VRYSGASLGFQIGAALSGGLTAFAAAVFMAWIGGATWPVYLIALALITFFATMTAPETAGRPLKWGISQVCGGDTATLHKAAP
jgi:MFS transporter, MHS family, shikimate and dehydroshikimate transport protein